MTETRKILSDDRIMQVAKAIDDKIPEEMGFLVEKR